MRFDQIPQLPRAMFACDVPWGMLEEHLARWVDDGLDLDPDYQRAHVWTSAQQIAYVEYMLRGGEVGRGVTFNCPGWLRGKRKRFELVDGKQRIEAVRAFLRGDIPAFGRLYAEYEDELSVDLSFRFRVCTLQTREEILTLYLNINAGGTPHSEEELNRVRAMLESERPAGEPVAEG